VLHSSQNASHVSAVSIAIDAFAKERIHMLLLGSDEGVVATFDLSRNGRVVKLWGKFIVLLIQSCVQEKDIHTRT